jgi:hypothetical protein
MVPYLPFSKITVKDPAPKAMMAVGVLTAVDLSDPELPFLAMLWAKDPHSPSTSLHKALKPH